jgi:hypothetical protein
MPLWADPHAIEEIYAEARRLQRETGIPHHVDHIVPLRSVLVCGLHWEGNLAVVEKTVNLRKSNKHWPEMP